MDQKRVTAVLLAAGSGSRMNLSLTKQRLSIKGKSVLFHSLLAFEKCDCITDVILVLREEEKDLFLSEIKGITKLRKIVVGADTRIGSAKAGFFAIDFPCDYVAVHDVARCLIKPEMITKVVLDAFLYGAASASSLVVDTVKKVDGDGFVVSTENRNNLRLAGTPQIFEYGLYGKAISSVDPFDSTVTDDNMLMERIGVRVYMTDVGKNNLKITYAEDVLFAEYILEQENE